MTNKILQNLSKSIKKNIRRMFYRINIDLKLLSPSSNSYIQLIKYLDSYNIDTVFDIGANTGQFASELRWFGYQGKIISFEPLQDEHRLLSKAAEKDKKWIVHRRSAIGETDGVIEINVSGNSVSSSILPILESHISSAKDSDYVGTETVEISCIDTIAHVYLSSESRYFIKIDTQGFEWQVLNGAKEIMKKAQGVLCELSLTPLYEGQHLWLDILHRLESEGFQIWSIEQAFVNKKNGRTLQINACFSRF